MSLYALPAPDAGTEAEFAPIRSDKGTARFPLDQPMPYDLVAGVVERLAEQRDQARV